MIAVCCLAAAQPVRASEPESTQSAPLSVDAPMAFTRAHSTDEQDLEARLRARISRERIRANLEHLASRPHRAGSPADHETAEWIAAQLRNSGLDAQVVEYVHYLSSPVSVSAEIVLPDAVPLKLTEDVIEADPYTRDAAAHPGWNAYSASGTATAQIVYAHHGSQQDFAELERLGVDLKHRILLMRYFGAGEGAKVLSAQHAGADAVILYSDPADDGYVYGDTYPDGPWRPAGSIMRRSVFDENGDPLSPGWAAKPGAKRLSPSDVDALPRIPVLPIAYRDAEKILKRLAGPVVPAGWQGGLPLTYHVGPGPVTVHLDVKMDNHDGHIWDVIARIPGGEFPDEWLVLSNHHDAWIYGAGDPSSGTAAMLELGRALGTLLADGWRPHRTLVLALFDAEEITLGGATEWMEDHARELEQKVVAVLNMDSAVFNPDRPLSVSTSASMRGLWLDAARAVPDPRRGIPTYDVWLELQNRFRNVASVDVSEPKGDLPPLTAPSVFGDPIGDDQTVFYLHLALPVSDMYYGADYGVYHSLYEDLHWMETIVDPDFGYHAMMAAFLGTAGLRMAEADLVPFDLESAAIAWQLALADLRESFGVSDEQRAAIDDLDRIAKQWQAAGADLNAARRALFFAAASAEIPAQQWRDLNAKLRRVERSFYVPGGLPGSKWSRNLLSAMRFGSEETTLPGLRWSIEDRKPEQFRAQTSVYAKALETARDLTRELSAELRAATTPAPSR